MDLVRHTIGLALKNVENRGRPFTCVTSRDGEVVAESLNLVVQTRDPTAHPEIATIRQAWQRLGTENLEGHEIYVLAHPCPMCLGALYYCSPDRVMFLTTSDEYSRYLQAVAGAPAADGAPTGRRRRRSLPALARVEPVIRREDSGPSYPGASSRGRPMLSPRLRWT